MSDKRDLRLHKYEIDTDQYRELFYFCKRYHERESQINLLRGLTEVVAGGMPRGSAISDPTCRKAEKILKLRADNEMIEQTAIETDSFIYKYLIKNITQGISYEYLNCPCGRRQFYEKRRLFFKLLSEKR